MSHTPRFGVAQRASARVAAPLGRLLSRAMVTVALFVIWGCSSAPERPPSITAGSALAAHSAHARTETTRARAPSSPLPVLASDPSSGAPHAPVTLLVFTDFECAECVAAQERVRELQRRYGPDELRVVYKITPRSERTLGAAVAAQAAFEASGFEGFSAYIELLFSNPRALFGADLAAYAEEIGVAPDQFAALRASSTVQTHVRRTVELARRVGIRVLPAFYLNGLELTPSEPLSAHVAAVEGERGESDRLLQQGTAAGARYALRVQKNYRPKLNVAPPPDDERAVSARRFAIPIGESPVLGPPDALVTVVEFSEYQCPYCRAAQHTMRELLERYPRDLRLVFKHNPLPMHESARGAATLAIEAQRQLGNAGFWRASELLFELSPNLATAQLLTVAKRLNLDASRVERALATSAHDRVIDGDQALAERAGIDVAPVFFVNGRLLRGAQPLAVFIAAVEAEKAAAEERVASGVARAKLYDVLVKEAEAAAPVRAK